jgi:hypothetical protein
MVHEKMEKGVYSTLPEVVADLAALTDNAKRGFDSGTAEHRDGEILGRALEDAKIYAVV